MRHTRLVIALAALIALVLGTGTTYVIVRHADDGDDERRIACAVPCFGAPSAALPTAGPESAADSPTMTGLEQILLEYLTRPELGELAATVLDHRTGEVSWQHRGEVMMVPASVNKLVTAVAVLAARGPSYRIPTHVRAGASAGEVVLVGGGDVTLTAGDDGYYAGAARLDDLAAALKRAHPEPITTVIVDSSRYVGPGTAPGWDADVASGGYGAPATPLALDGARTAPGDGRSSTPDLDAGRAFAERLATPDSSVQVRLREEAEGADGPKAAEGLEAGAGDSDTGVPTGSLAVAQSPPIAALVEVMLSDSDNVVAESLARQVAMARGEPASFAGAAVAVGETLRELGIELGGARLIDGSGLSRDNRLSTTLLARLLDLAAQPDQKQLRPALAALPVAGFTGTLHDRFDRDAAVGGRSVVRAKTGSLSQVSSLAGTIVTADGAALSFAVIANGFPVNGADRAEQVLDELATRLAACGCR